MYSLYVFMDRYTKPILPPLLVEKDCGRYFVENNISGRVYLVSGDFEDIFKFIKSHNQIWLGFQDVSTEDNLVLEKWVRPQ
jgi:hypothetical protein